MTKLSTSLQRIALLALLWSMLFSYENASALTLLPEPKEETLSKENLKSNNIFLEAPYFLQRENYYEPGGTCGLTSAAMLINFWGQVSTSFVSRNVTPDELYLKFGKRKGQSPDTLATLYRSFGLNSDYTYKGTREDIKKHLDNGRPVVVHGWFTKSGHIIVLTGYNENGFIANDPAGEWIGCYKCGYKSGGYGKSILYTYAQMNTSVLGKDGDIWYSYILEN